MTRRQMSRKARADCPRCGRNVAAYVPRHGDGTAFRLVKHMRDPKDDRKDCAGRFDTIDDLTDEGWVSQWHPDFLKPKH